MAKARPERDVDQTIRHMEQSVKRNADQTVSHIERAASEVDQSVQETVRKVAEETGRAGRMMADAGERAFHEILERNAEALQRVMQSQSELASRLTSRSADQFARAFGMGGEETKSAVQQSTRNLNAVVRSSATLSQGAQTISTQWFEFMREQLEQYMDRVEALMRCRTPQELAAVQSDVIRDQLQSIIETTRRAADLSAQAANEASRHMSEAVEAARRAA